MIRDSDEMPKNVLAGPLQPCSERPLTGFYRDGCCNTGEYVSLAELKKYAIDLN